MWYAAICDDIWYDMIYDIWYDAVYDMIWNMVYDIIWYGIWYDMVYDMVYDRIWYCAWHDRIWYMIWYDIWCMIRYMIYRMIWYDIWYMIYDIWYDMIDDVYGLSCGAYVRFSHLQLDSGHCDMQLLCPKDRVQPRWSSLRSALPTSPSLCILYVTVHRLTELA